MQTTVALTALVLGPVGGESFGQESARAQGLAWRFEQLAADVARLGIDRVIEQLSGGQPPDRRLMAVLSECREVLRQDPGQLWFQLDCRTRLTGWEDIQRELQNHRPPEMLVARTSILSTRIDDRTIAARPDAAQLMRLSSDSNELYYVMKNREVLVLDARAPQEEIRRIALPGRVLSVIRGPGGRDCFVVDWGRSNAANTRVSIHDARSGETVLSLDESIWLRGPLDVNPPFQFSRDGSSVVYWHESGFLDRDVANLENTTSFKFRTEAGSFKSIWLEFLDDRRLISLDDGGYVRILGYPGGKELSPPRRLVQRVEQFAISRDRSRIACSGTVGGPVQQIDPHTFVQGTGYFIVVWDVQGRKEVAKFVHSPGADKTRVTAMAFLDNDSLVTGNQRGTLHRFNVGETAPVATVPAHAAPIRDLIAAPEAGRALSLAEDGLKIVDLSERADAPRPLPESPGRDFRRYASWDGRWEADATGRTITVWDGASGEVLQQVQVSPQLMKELKTLASLGFDIESQVLTLGGQAGVARCNLSTREERFIEVDVSGLDWLRRIKLSERPPFFVSPDGRHAAMWSGQQLATFDAGSGERKLTFEIERRLGRVHHFLRGDRLAVSVSTRDGDGVRIFDLAGGAHVDCIHGRSCMGSAYASAADVIVTAGKRGAGPQERDSLAVWRAGSLPEHVELPADFRVLRIGVNREATRAIMIARAGDVLLWDLAEQKLVRRFSLGIPMRALAFDGRTLIVTAGDGRTRHYFEYVSAGAE